MWISYRTSQCRFLLLEKIYFSLLKLIIYSCNLINRAFQLIMCNLVLKAFEQVRTGTTPTPYLTLVIDKTGTFIATWNQIKNQKYELLRRVSQTFPPNRQTFTSFVLLIGLSQVGLLGLLLFAEVVYSLLPLIERFSNDREITRLLLLWF